MAIDVSKLPDEAQKALDLFPEFEPASFSNLGANSYVLIGRHRVLKEARAIKIYFHDESDIDQEPAIISSIKHENVLEVYDARRIQSNCSFYLMLAANEGDLHQFLEKYNLCTHLSHKLLCQLLSGLSALHASPNNLVHRDLKPENLLIDNDKMLIADFGSIRKIDNSTGKAPASNLSILYRPAESFGEDAFFDYSSDIYQAGCIGYLLFGGKLSNSLDGYLNKHEKSNLKIIIKDGDDFDKSKFIDSCIEKKIKGKRLLDWSSIPSIVPKNIVRLLKKATSDNETRFSNTSEFLAQLTKVRTNLPDWIQVTNGYELRNWNGSDYMLIEEKGNFLIRKKKNSSTDYRVDRSIRGISYSEVFTKLKQKIKLP